MEIIDISFRDIFVDEKIIIIIIIIMAFPTKLLLLAQYHCILGSMK